MEKEKKGSKNTLKIFLLGTVIIGVILLYLRDEAGISGFFNWMLTTGGYAIGILVVSAFAAAIAGVIMQQFDGKERKLDDPEVLSAMLVALVASFLIIKAESVGPQDVARRMSLHEVLEAYEERDDRETYDELFYFLKNHASDDYSDYELIEKLGIDPREFAYDYVMDR